MRNIVDVCFLCYYIFNCLTTVGLCARWNIFIIPLFKIGFNHFENVERIIDTSIEDCRWKNYTLNIKFITKDLVFHDVVDPIQPIEIDDDLRVLSLYTEEEKNHAYTHALLIAEQMMSKATEEVGNFILLFTDSVRFTEDKVLLRFVDKALHSKFIQLRVVQLLYNDQKGSQKDIAKMVTKVTDNIGRISLYETHDLLESIKPCPALTNQQKLFQYGEVMKIRRYLYALERNYLLFISRYN
uniref:VWFA domain-containing protein n=1 Tax=Rhabditophanes sp. KR3021 TaxID=114890 RepID=A0AC35THS1_9BILA